MESDQKSHCAQKVTNDLHCNVLCYVLRVRLVSYVLC